MWGLGEGIRKKYHLTLSSPISTDVRTPFIDSLLVIVAKGIEFFDKWNDEQQKVTRLKRVRFQLTHWNTRPRGFYPETRKVRSAWP